MKWKLIREAQCIHVVSPPPPYFFFSLSPLCVLCTLWCRCGHSAQFHIGIWARLRDLGLGLNIVVSRAPHAMQCNPTTNPYNILWKPIFYHLPLPSWTKWLSHGAKSADNVTATRDSSWAHVSLHWHRVHRPLSQSHWPGLNKSFMCQFSSLLAIEIRKSSVCSLNFPNWFNWRHCFHICIHLCIFFLVFGSSVMLVKSWSELKCLSVYFSRS